MKKLFLFLFMNIATSSLLYSAEKGAEAVQKRSDLIELHSPKGLELIGNLQIKYPDLLPPSRSSLTFKAPLQIRR